MPTATAKSRPRTRRLPRDRAARAGTDRAAAGGGASIRPTESAPAARAPADRRPAPARAGGAPPRGRGGGPPWRPPAVLHAALAFARRLGRDDVGAYAAALTYSLLFAVFPLGLSLTAALVWLHLPGLERSLLRPLQSVLAPEVLDLVQRTVLGAPSRSPALVLGGAAGYMLGMSSAFRQAIDAFNHAYEYAPPWHRRTWQTYLLSFALATAFGLAVVAAVVVAALGQDVAAGAASSAAARPEASGIGALLPWAILLVLASIVVDVLYWVAPDRPRRFRWPSRGGVVAVAAWLVVSFGFSTYLGHFNSYNRIYGSFGAVILLLLYLYFLSYSLLVGAEVNAAADGAGRDPPRPTAGPDA